ncbi:MAG: tetraacyldisaccharide 4'-kinase [Rickettsiales bacterium]|nr:tetraacyldisaccharide 4'-kinase [Rickettsiales bacterium]
MKKNALAYLLLPLAAMYYLVSRLVYFCRLFYQKRSKRPVICVGNIFAGGVGKTPIVMEIARRLGALVVMRGYRRGRNDIGDEAKMLKKAGIRVYVGNRKTNVRMLNGRRDNGPIVMDDGFQNPGVKKDISILVFDQRLGFGNGFVLPAGPLREPACAIRRADAVIVIGYRVLGNGYHRFISEIKSFGKPVFFAENKTLIPDSLELIPVIAFAGIGYPQKFFDALMPRAVKTIGFPDHHKYTESDLNRLFLMAKKERAALLTTEKDWVRLPPAMRKKIHVAKLETTVEPAFWTWLSERLKESL